MRDRAHPFSSFKHEDLEEKIEIIILFTPKKEKKKK